MPMYDPAHPGGAIRANLEELGWTVTECARKVGSSAQHVVPIAE